MKNPTIGVVVISWNEERDLPGFLSNLIDWVDEIVIVDDGSTDETSNLACQAGKKVKFIESPRSKGQYFSHQRNKGIDAASSDWLLHLDIDERVPDDLKNEILFAIQNSNFDAYRYRRLNFFLHRPMKAGGWQSWNLVHLAKREVLRFSGMYHEDCIVDTPSNRVGQLTNRMWHLNEESYSERLQKSNRYIEEEAVNLEKLGYKVKWWHFCWLPLLDFGKSFIYKAGFKDKTPGLLFALHSASAKFKACALLWDKQNKLSRELIEEQVNSIKSDV